MLALFPASLAVAVFFMTRNTKREFSANTLVYTGLASGYTLESGDNDRIDYFTVNNAFDNLINTVKARTNLEEVGIRLLASHLMLRKTDRSVANEETIRHLHEVLPEKVIRQVVNYQSLDQTVENIYRYSQISKNVIAEKLLNPKDGPYSVKGITSKLTVVREGTSDMVKITYYANDPAVVKQTLELITSVFVRRYREMKVSETSNVVTYFEEQLRTASERLTGSENKLKDFASQNNIINYEEQTRNISAQERDIETEIQSVRSELEASKSALKNLEGKLSIRQDVALKNQRMNSLRDSLSLLNSRLAMLEMNPESSQADVERIKNSIGQYEQRTRSSINDLYDTNNSKNGVPGKLMFDDWIDAFVSVDKNEARLLVLSDIKRNHGRHYKQLAPLGSGLSRLEREINVAEKEYLEILHGLNVSKLREQNLLLSTNLKIIDPPKFPAQPEPSKRLILVIASFMVGLMLVLGFIVGKEYFDWSLKKSTRAENQVGLPFVGGLPLLETSKSYVHYGTIEDRTLNQCVSRIKRLAQTTAQQPVWILLFSIKEGTGKSHFAARLQKKISQGGDKAIWFNPHGLSDQAGGVVPYRWQPDLGSLDSLKEKVPRVAWEQVQFVLVELPALLNYPLLTQWVQQAGFSLLVADATAVWRTSDQYALQTYVETTPAPVGLLLNQVRHDQLEELIGEVPRDRSSLRQWLKHLLIPAAVVSQNHALPNNAEAIHWRTFPTTPPRTASVDETKSTTLNPTNQVEQKETPHKSGNSRRRHASRYGWLLKSSMFVGVVIGIAFLWWAISPRAKGQDFLMYWFTPPALTTEEAVAAELPSVSDSSAFDQELIALADTTQVLAQDTSLFVVQDDWDTAPTVVEPKPVEPKKETPALTETKVAPEQPATPKAIAEETPAAGTTTVYYVQAGSFKDRNSARQRQRELMGGGYQVKIQDADPAGGNYQVTTGPYQNYKQAQDAAQSIGFILEIKTSILKKQE